MAGVGTGAGVGRDTLIAKPETLGFGINLQGASVVAYSGIGDSFEKDYQSLRRAFRYGQTRAIRCGYVLTSLERMMLDNVRAKRAAWEAQTLAMEDAFAKAARSRYGQETNIRAEINPRSGEIRLHRLPSPVAAAQP